MPDEPQDPVTEPVVEPAPEPEAGTATAEAPAAQEKKPEKLRQNVLITDVGPCRKHIKVTVDRRDINDLLDEKYRELVHDSQVPGFRPGKAPREVVVRKFHKDVSNQVKSQVLMASLEQLADDYDIAPLSAPNINAEKLDIPKDGDFVYEFEVEVRPQFDVPNYKGLSLKRPIKDFTDQDVAAEEKRVLAQRGKLIPKEEGNAQIGDFLTVDMTTRYGDKVIGTAQNIDLRIDDSLAFKDGVAEKFAEQVQGAMPGETRTVEISMSDAVAVEQLRGQKVQAVLEVKGVKKMELPELTHDFLHQFGVHNEEQFREKIRGYLESRLEYHQRQAARQQVLEQITAASEWDLPQDMLRRQAKKALARRVMEMRDAGMSDDEIKGRQRLLERDTLNSTAWALKEHFVLQKIAETEKIEATEDDLENEIERIADQSNQSPRRVRAQIEKEDLMDSLYAQITERKVLDLILDSAEYDDVPLVPEKVVATVEEQAVPGELKDPTAAPPEAKPAEEAAPSA